jgi:hypothetical protein
MDGAQMVPLGPGDLPAVFDCLRSALSHDPATQKQAEAALHELETRPGFCSCLAEILASKDADHSARWLAAVHLKNSCNKYWRSRLPGWVLGTWVLLLRMPAVHPGACCMQWCGACRAEQCRGATICRTPCAAAL